MKMLKEANLDDQFLAQITKAQAAVDKLNEIVKAMKKESIKLVSSQKGYVTSFKMDVDDLAKSIAD